VVPYAPFAHLKYFTSVTMEVVLERFGAAVGRAVTLLERYNGTRATSNRLAYTGVCAQLLRASAELHAAFNECIDEAMCVEWCYYVQMTAPDERRCWKGAGTVDATLAAAPWDGLEWDG
jgi:hypothetical protein